MKGGDESPEVLAETPLNHKKALCPMKADSLALEAHSQILYLIVYSYRTPPFGRRRARILLHPLRMHEHYCFDEFQPVRSNHRNPGT